MAIILVESFKHIYRNSRNIVYMHAVLFASVEGVVKIYSMKIRETRKMNKLKVNIQKERERESEVRWDRK
jgi:hypothetical protein